LIDVIAALLLAAAAGLPPSESTTLAEASVELANAWKIDAAEQTARRAFETAIRCEDPIGRARSLEAWSIAERLRGRADAAMAMAEESLAVAAASGDDDGRARAHNAMGRVYADLLDRRDDARSEFQSVLGIPVTDQRIVVRAWLNLGNLALAERDLRAARVSFLDASKAAAGIDDLQGRIASEHNIGLTYAFQNDPTHALESFTRAADLDRRAGGAQQARILLSMSEARRALGAGDAASETLTLAKRAATKSGDTAALSTILLRQGDLQVSRGDLAAAARAFDQSESIARALSDDSTLALVDAYRAKMMLAGRRWREASELGSKSAHAAEALGQPETLALAATTAGTAWRRLGDFAAARRSFERAIGAVEQQRRSVAGGFDARLRFFESELSPYAAMVELLVSDGDASGALAFAQGAKARVIGDARRSDARRPRRPLEGEAFIEYSVCGETVYAFVGTTSGTRVVTLGQRRSRIATLALTFARELAVRNLAFRPTARLLYDALVAPLAIGASTRLVIAPDLDLWLVPFHALIGPDDRFLIERATISYAPSGALITEPAQRKLPRVLLTANLPDGARELEAISRVWTPKPVVMNDATEGNFKTQARRFDLVHVAAHGIYDDADPLQSYLAFDVSPGEDGRLTAQEVLRLKLPAQLFILSACDMAVGRPAAGEGLVGMTWALMIAGAETIVAAKWEVDSETTTRLMLEFHRALATGSSPADALRTAQLNLLRSSQWVHPFYWAAFVDVGGGG
jgi:CHAT domain-containing protein/tetratricopeptide (TPR) repeat protein